MTLLTHLGQASVYKSQYDKSLLHQIKRSVARAGLKFPEKSPEKLDGNSPRDLLEKLQQEAFAQNHAGIKDKAQTEHGRVNQLADQGLPFYGYDLWNCYELSWLNPSGKPEVRILEFAISAASEYIVESKSLKLYLNSFNNTKFASQQEVTQTIKADLEECLGAIVFLSIKHLEEYTEQKLGIFKGVHLDQFDIAIDNFEIKEHLPRLAAALSDKKLGQTLEIEEFLYSNLLKSNCPVTNQPDWASIQIHYRGPVMDHKSLLAYIVSFRNHNEFHEHCIERIFCDLLEHCRPSQLTVYGRYTRRGGIDINPIRSTNYLEITKLDNSRHVRQ